MKWNGMEWNMEGKTTFDNMTPGSPTMAILWLAFLFNSFEFFPFHEKIQWQLFNIAV